MGYIPENQIADLKDRINIVDIISQYVNLKRAGSSYKGLCPFHHEKTPSFMVSEEKNNFHCFGCHKGGDAITFIMEIENLNYIDAIRFLADKMGITLEENEYSSAKTEKRNRMYEINSLTAKFYFKNLLTEDIPQKYMEDRGLSKRILNSFYLGYAKSTDDRINDDLIRYLESKNISKEEMLEIGLISYKDGRYFDKFTDRLIFPIINNKNKVIGFGGRTLTNSKVKYLNSPESEIFIKGQNIYGANIINKTRNRAKIILVEGYMDVIGLFNQGIDYAVATLGTALTQEQANLIKRYNKNILIAYDGDEAGIKATLRAIDIFKNMNVNLGIISFPDNLDPDEFINKYGREKFEELLEKPISPIDFKLKKLYERTKTKIDFVKEIIEFLAEIEGNVLRDLYINKASNFIDVSVQSIRDDVNNLIADRNKKEEFKRKNSVKSANNGYKQNISREKLSKEKKSTNKNNNESIQREILVYSLLEKKYFDLLSEYFPLVTNEDYKNILDNIKRYFNKEISLEKIIYDDNFQRLNIKREYELVKDNINVPNIVVELKERLERFKLNLEKEKLEKLLKEDKSNKEAFLRLTEVLQKLT